MFGLAEFELLILSVWHLNWKQNCETKQVDRLVSISVFYLFTKIAAKFTRRQKYHTSCLKSWYWNCTLCKDIVKIYLPLSSDNRKQVITFSISSGLSGQPSQREGGYLESQDRRQVRSYLTLHGIFSIWIRIIKPILRSPRFLHLHRTY